MFEKVNPSHPDKIADRIAGAIVDIAYGKEENPKIAVEVLIGHHICRIVAESSVSISNEEANAVVARIAGGGYAVVFSIVAQDKHLADNQAHGVRCGDNGIFRGVPTSPEERVLTDMAQQIYRAFPSDGKYIISGKQLNESRIIICQSRANKKELTEVMKEIDYCTPAVGGYAQINPLGEWTGGPDVDCGATNRKLGSDMGRAITGGGLHGKDLSKADVSVNIYLHLLAEQTGREYKAVCAIGDEDVMIITGERAEPTHFSEIVETARHYIIRRGGFEKFAEWGLIV